MHGAEDATLIVVTDADIVEKLEPECLQLVSIVLKQVEVVAYC